MALTAGVRKEEDRTENGKQRHPFWFWSRPNAPVYPE